MGVDEWVIHSRDENKWINTVQSEENTLQAWEQTDHEAICVHPVERTTWVYFSWYLQFRPYLHPTCIIAPTSLFSSHVRINAAQPNPTQYNSRSGGPRRGGGRKPSMEKETFRFGASIESHPLAYIQKEWIAVVGCLYIILSLASIWHGWITFKSSVSDLWYVVMKFGVGGLKERK